MPKAVWNGVIIAESDATEMVEGNHYFPPASVNRDYLRANPKTTICPWKGIAGYYDIEVEGEVNPAAAWTYPDPKAKASHIKDYVAFWHGVEVEDGPGKGLFRR